MHSADRPRLEEALAAHAKMVKEDPIRQIKARYKHALKTAFLGFSIGTLGGTLVGAVGGAQAVEEIESLSGRELDESAHIHLDRIVELQEATPLLDKGSLVLRAGSATLFAVHGALLGFALGFGAGVINNALGRKDEKKGRRA